MAERSIRVRMTCNRSLAESASMSTLYYKVNPLSSTQMNPRVLSAYLFRNCIRLCAEPGTAPAVEFYRQKECHPKCFHFGWRVFAVQSPNLIHFLLCVSLCLGGLCFSLRLLLVRLYLRVGLFLGLFQSCLLGLCIGLSLFLRRCHRVINRFLAFV